MLPPIAPSRKDGAGGPSRTEQDQPAHGRAMGSQDATERLKRGGVERKRRDFNKDKPQTKSPATQPLQQASSWETRTQRHHSVFLSSARG